MILNKSSHIFILGFTVISVVSGQIPALGPCPNIPAVANFNKAAFAGNWVEVEKLIVLPEVLDICVAVQYNLTTAGTYTTQIGMTDIVTGKRKVLHGVTYFLEDTTASSTGRVELVLDLVNFAVPLPTPQYTYPYGIIATDYTSYMIKWACVPGLNPSPINYQTLWVLARDGKAYPGSATQATVRTFLNSNGLPTPLLIPTQQC